MDNIKEGEFGWQYYQAQQWSPLAVNAGQQAETGPERSSLFFFCRSKQSRTQQIGRRTQTTVEVVLKTMIFWCRRVFPGADDGGWDIRQLTIRQRHWRHWLSVSKTSGIYILLHIVTYWVLATSSAALSQISRTLTTAWNRKSDHVYTDISRDRCEAHWTVCINQLAYCTSIWRSPRSVATTINTAGFAFMDFSPGAVYLCVMFLAGGKRTLFIVSEYPRWSAERHPRTSADIHVFRSSGDITWLYTHSYSLRLTLRTSERAMYDL